MQEADTAAVARHPRIPVERSIAAGGGYTINAFKYVFEEVAKETTRVIKTQLLVPRPTASLQ